jgi:hypothetical protein
MTDGVASSVVAVAALRAALEEMADALGQASLDRLLACEARIETALSQVPTKGLSADTRADVRREVEAARLALLRCRRLGLSLDGFIAAGLTVRGLSGFYGPDAAAISTELHSLNLKA